MERSVKEETSEIEEERKKTINHRLRRKRFGWIDQERGGGRKMEGGRKRERRKRQFGDMMRRKRGRGD